MEFDPFPPFDEIVAEFGLQLKEEEARGAGVDRSTAGTSYESGVIEVVNLMNQRVVEEKIDPPTES